MNVVPQMNEVQLSELDNYGLARFVAYLSPQHAHDLASRLHRAASSIELRQQPQNVSETASYAGLQSALNFATAVCKEKCDELSKLKAELSDLRALSMLLDEQLTAFSVGAYLPTGLREAWGIWSDRLPS